MDPDSREACLNESGLSKNESKVYLVLLELGPAIASSIADRTKLHRANVYEALSKLQRRGLVSVFERDEKKLYEASEPEALLNILREKEERLKGILPQLQLAKRMSVPSSGEARIFEGVQAIHNTLEGFLNYGEPILAYGVPKIAPEIVRHFIMQFHKKRISKRVKMYHIYNFDARERISFLNTLPYTYAKALPIRFNSDVATNVCGDEVAFLLFGDRCFVIRIKQREIAETYKRYFHLLWKQARIPK